MSSRKNAVDTFTEGTELLLLQHVLSNATDGSPASVMENIDKFGWEQRWVMCVGDVKGKFLDDALGLVTPQPCTTVLELGLYCGYSATRIASQLPAHGKLYSVEPSELHRTVASQVLAKAGLQDKVEIYAGTGQEAIPALAARGLKFDLVFIDHKKEAYLSDLKLMEAHGVMRAGTVVVADNVVVFKLEEYLAHVRSSGKYSSSVLHTANVEYSDDTPDGVEVSVYAG
jgi:catechol O-methyltransferase